jgi:sterol desaturase/sphingolipid hydroxylase (fatty acid hydroxylase superfamily)
MSASGDLPNSANGGWTPALPLTVPAPLLWPPQPIRILQYLFGFPGLFFPWLALYAAIAFGLWSVLAAAGADLTRLSAGWILPLFACNEALAVIFYGAWHYVLYGRRFQATQYKYNASWPREQSEHFLFGKPLLSNVLWSLMSGVPVWTIYLVLTLWAQATGLAPTTSWSQAPVYCSFLLFGLVFFHALHFYVGHRIIHWQPLYNSVHYLHHANVNPSPWSGLAMHPVEHAIYFSGALLLWVVPATPMHALYFTTLVALAPAEGHCGFGKVVVGGRSFATDNYYHYLHHKFFRVNFGDSLLIPLDRLFGTFHDGIRRVSTTKGGDGH